MGISGDGIVQSVGVARGGDGEVRWRGGGALWSWLLLSTGRRGGGALWRWFLLSTWRTTGRVI